MQLLSLCGFKGLLYILLHLQEAFVHTAVEKLVTASWLGLWRAPY